MNFLLLTAFVAFLIGAVPFGVLFSQLLGKTDIRKMGSNNIGTINVIRNLGWMVGSLTFIFDAGKGALFSYLFTYNEWKNLFSTLSLESNIQESHGIWIVGISAVLGHCFSPFLRGKGGKGVATTFGAFSVISWPITLISLVVFGFIFWVKKIGSIASLLSIGFMFLAFWVTKATDYFELALMLFWITLVVVRHKNNIEDLLGERERVF